MILFASDLDNTLIYSYRKIEGESICVEEKNGKKLSYMTKECYDLLQKLERDINFVPITTRSLEQYRRIKLLESRNPHYALTSNGGILLVNNVIDKKWYLDSKKLIQNAVCEMEIGIELLKTDKNVYFEVKLVDELFVFTKTHDIRASFENLQINLNLDLVTVDMNGEKIYIVPKCLNKGNGLRRLKQRLNADKVVAAGDSSFDISMLLEADVALIPNKDFLKYELNNAYDLRVYENDDIHFGNHVVNLVQSLVINN